MATIHDRALLLYDEYKRESNSENPQFELLVQLVDATYQFADLELQLGNYVTGNSATVCLVPSEIELSFMYVKEENQKSQESISGSMSLKRSRAVATKKEHKVEPFTLIVNVHDSVNKILQTISSSKLTCSPDTFVLQSRKTTLFRPLSIVEQDPGCLQLDIRDSGTEAVRVPFFHLYLHGPVFLPLSDAIHLSAYLLQAEIGPSRCFNGQISSLNAFLPERFSKTPGAAEDLHSEWCFLHSTTRQDAMANFVDNVQRLPLFNATSVNCIWLDQKYSTEKNFELIFTEHRMIFLDNTAFKTRLSIDYDHLLSVQRDTNKVILKWTDDFVTKQILKIQSETARTVFFNIANMQHHHENGKDADDLEFTTDTKYKFKSLKTDFAGQAQNYWPIEYVKAFAMMNEGENEFNVSTSDINHALLIRATSAAFHLSVLLSKVTANNAEILKNEIVSYHNRLMGYLTYLTYDHRPYDTASNLYTLFPQLHKKYQESCQVIDKCFQELHVVEERFVTNSTDPLYISSQNVVAYQLAHLLSYKELFTATDDPSAKQHEGLIQAFLVNGGELKELVQSYIFNVGDIELKKELQTRLDFVFKNHLESLQLVHLISERSQFSDIDPSIILHQDSCNIMITAMVEFSKLLWADREQLTPDQLKAFLEQAEILCREIVRLKEYTSIIIKTVRDFSKIVELNLPILVSTNKLCFSLVQVQIHRLVDAYELNNNLGNLHMQTKLLQVAASLALVQPHVLVPEIKDLFDHLKRTGKSMYQLVVHDLPLIDLSPEEGENCDLCSLKCYVLDRVGKKEFDKLNDMYVNLIPAFALQQLLKRQLTEWTNSFVNLYTYTMWLYTAFAKQIIYRAKALVNNETVTVSEQTKKALNVDEVTDFSPIIAEIDTHYLVKYLEIIKNEPSLATSQHVEIIEMAINAAPEIYPNLPEAEDHVQIAILHNAVLDTCWITFNSVAIFLRSNAAMVMAAFSQCSIALQIMLSIVYKVCFQPSYFGAPSYWHKLQQRLVHLNNGVGSYYASGIISIPFINEFNSISPLLASISTMSCSTELTSLWPLEDLHLESTIDGQYAADRREDMATLMSDYRVTKNAIVEAILLRDLNNLVKLIKDLGANLQEMIGLSNILSKDNELAPLLCSEFDKFVKAIPRVWSYYLGTIHLKSTILPLDKTVDKIVDLVGSKLFDPATAESVDSLLEKVISFTFSPHDRNIFVHEFAGQIRSIQTSHPQVDDENEFLQVLLDILMCLQDNDMHELKRTSLSLPMECSQPLMKLMKDNAYVKTVRVCERVTEDIEYTDAFRWYKDAVKTVARGIASSPANQKSITLLNALMDKIDETFVASLETLPIIVSNIDTALQTEKNLVLVQLKENAVKVGAYIAELSTIYHETLTKLLQDNECTGTSLQYKDAIQQIINSFFNEYTRQYWEVDPFKALCESVLQPLENGFSSAFIADSLLSTRRALRQIRLLKRTASSRFIVETERMINHLEHALNVAFAGEEQKNTTRLERQRAIIDSYVERLTKLRESQMKKFIVRLMQNFALDLSSFNTLEADQLSHSIIRLFDGLNESMDKASQLRTLIHWFETMEKGILPIDYDRVLEILRSIESRLTDSEEELFIYDQDQLVDIAVRLSDVLAKFAGIRDSLALVKDMHLLYKMKATLVKFIMTLMRALEAYADEIHTFSCVSHPTLNVIKSAPNMCHKLENLIESSFLKTMTARHMEEAVEAINEFIAECPDDLRGSVEQVAKEPLELLRNPDQFLAAASPPQ